MDQLSTMHDRLSMSTRVPMTAPLPGVLWIAGVTAALAWVAGHLLPFEGESFDTAAYLFLVTLIPLATLLLAKLSAGSWLKYALVAAMVVICFEGLVRTKDLLALLLFLSLTWVQMQLVEIAEPRSRRVELTALGMLVFTGWLTVASLIWWRPWIADLDTHAWGIAVLIVCTVGCGWAALGDWEAETSVGFRRSTSVLFALLFAAAASRPVYDMGYGAGNTQGYLLGTIDLVRQGGWLLWDVPSQYGFLNVAWAAWMPAHGSLQALLIADAPLIWVCAMLFYFRAVRVFPGYWGRIFCGLLTLAAVLMLPGWAPDLSGPHIAPSVGAFRFLWAYVLTGILLLVDEGAAEPKRSRWLLGGCVAWVLGCLWSAESALCATAVWLPAYSMGVWKKPILGHRSLSLAAPLVLMAVAITVIWSIYDLRLGHGPDWYAFIEYLLLYVGGGMGSIVADWQGPVAFIIGMFAIVVTGAWLAQVHAPTRLPSVLGALALFVASTDYFVGRSHPNNVVNIVPLLLLSAFTILSSLRDLPHGSRNESLWLRMALVPFMAMSMFAAYGDRDNTLKYAHSLFQGHRLDQLDRLPPALPPELVDTLRQAHVQEGDPLILYGSQLLPRWQSLLWLPLAPAEQLSLLPEARRQTYLCRFAERVPRGGWLVFPQKGTPNTLPYVWEAYSAEAQRTNGEILQGLIEAHGMITEPNADADWGLVQLGPASQRGSCNQPTGRPG